MNFQAIVAGVDASGVALLTLNRPAKLDALTIELRRETTACLATWAADVAVKAVILTGAGRALSAGFDIEEFQQPPLRDAILAISKAYHRDVWYFPRPTIGAVNGLAAGGGFDRDPSATCASAPSRPGSPTRSCWTRRERWRGSSWRRRRTRSGSPGSAWPTAGPGLRSVLRRGA